MKNQRPPLPTWVKAFIALAVLAGAAVAALHLSGHSFGHGF